jgi:cell division protein FtsX
MRFLVTLTMLAAVMAAPLPTAIAQEQAPRVTDDGAGDPELRRALSNYLERRLRTDIGLTDEQAATVLPKLEAMQGVQTRVRRDKRTTMQDLRRMYEGGATDAELQEALTRLDAIDDGLRNEIRQLMAEIDGALTVRQRVGFRFFLVQVREDVQNRMRQMRNLPGGEGRPRPQGNP